jgi:uncharacterized delta-60 repeat protein
MKRIFLITNFLLSVLVFAQPGTIDLTFNPGSGANNLVYTTSIQSDGKIIIGGTFTSYNGTSRKSIARLNTDGTLDTTFNPGTGTGTGNFGLRTTSIQSDGKIIIGGTFSSYNGFVRGNIARLNTDGTLDTDFNTGIGTNGEVITTSIQSDGKIIIGGTFTSYNGVNIRKIARLNTNGTLDTTFNPGTGASSTVFTTTIQSDGKIIIGGTFTSYNGTSTNSIARLNTDGTLDTSFNTGTGAIGSILTTAIQSNGQLIIGGNCTLYNGFAINKIARLNTNGTLDTSFSPVVSITNSLWTISIQSDGKIIVGGEVDLSNGIIRLNTDGTLDASFNPGTGPNGLLLSTSIQSDGKIIIGGWLTLYNGTTRNRIARINGDNALSSIGFENNILNIYPNPSNGIYTLQTNEMNDARSISIYSLVGQKLYDTVISSNETTIDVSNQPKGVYLYKVFGKEGETKNGKLVIE